MAGDERAHATQSQAASGPRGVPGLWAAAAVAIISALITGVLGRPGQASDSATPATVSRLAEIPQDEVAAALQTVSGSSEQIAQFRAREECRRKLAWVTIARLPGRPAGRIRLQSGKYVSPAFDLTDVPVRVALPYPAPYPAGHGTISVVGTTTDAEVALAPPWQTSAPQGFQSREVTWIPRGCPAANQPAG